tara:strand:- start:140 stop:349 length:210 start_codon:yes stop_codon:yes gene_type:complete
MEILLFSALYLLFSYVLAAVVLVGRIFVGESTSYPTAWGLASCVAVLNFLASFAFVGYSLLTLLLRSFT